MIQEMNKTGILVLAEIDPCKRFENVDRALLLALGEVLIPWSELIVTSHDPVETLKTLYAFPCYEMDGGNLNLENGEYNYPDDPIMYPLFKITNTINGHRTFIYEYEMIAVEKFDKTFYMTRVD